MLLFKNKSQAVSCKGEVFKNIVTLCLGSGFTGGDHDKLTDLGLIGFRDLSPRLADDSLGAVSYDGVSEFFRNRNADAIDNFFLRMALFQKTGMLIVENKHNDALCHNLFSFVIAFHKEMVFIDHTVFHNAFLSACRASSANKAKTPEENEIAFTSRGGFLNDLIGESCSALLSSSLENLATVSGRHSLSEAVFLLSLTNLRLIRSKHCSVLLTVFGVFTRIAHYIIMAVIGVCQEVWENF